MSEEKKKTYIGVKKVEAYPEDRDGKPGYAVIYPDGYKSWSPKEVFEAAYLPVELPNKLTSIDIVRMIEASEVDMYRLGNQTVAARITLPTGYEFMTSTRNSNAFPHDEGEHLCIDAAKGKLWELLGFVMQWASHGLKR